MLPAVSPDKDDHCPMKNRNPRQSDRSIHGVGTEATPNRGKGKLSERTNTMAPLSRDNAHQARAEDTSGDARWRKMPTSSVCAGEPRSLKASIGFDWVKRLSRVSRRIR